MLICAQAIEDVLRRRGLGRLWWGMRIRDAWPYAVGTRYAEAAQPLLERSDLEERGLLVVAVRNSAWMHELSFLDIAERLNHELGAALVRKVRFEVREALP